MKPQSDAHLEFQRVTANLRTTGGEATSSNWGCSDKANLSEIERRIAFE
jgi:hypothetical protein